MIYTIEDLNLQDNQIDWFDISKKQNSIAGFY